MLDSLALFSALIHDQRRMSEQSLTLKTDIEIPDTTPPAAHELRDLLDGWWERIIKVTVWRFIKRNSYQSLNSFVLDPGKVERAVVEETVMGIAQDYYEENGSAPTTFKPELELTNPQKKKNPPRKSCHFALGGTVGEVWDEPDPGRIEVEVMNMNRDLHGRVMDLSKVVADHGKEVTGRLTDALVREKEAIAAKAAADAELIEAERANTRDKVRDDQITNLMSLLEPAAQEVSKRLGVAAAEVFSGKKDEDDEEEDDEKPRRLKAADGPDEDEDFKKKHPDAYVARIFASTITSEQWFEVTEVFSKKQIRLLRAFTTVETNDEAIEKFRVFSKLLKTEQREKLEKLLADEQLTMIRHLFVASSKAAGKDESDDADD